MDAVIFFTDESRFEKHLIKIKKKIIFVEPVMNS